MQTNVKTGAVRSSEVSELEKRNADLSFRVARECIVLLKNDGTLPVEKGKVALYGNGVLKTIKGGTGSGEVNERHVVTLYEGMKNAGCTITSQSWLQDYQKEFDEGKLAFDEAARNKWVSAIKHLKIAEINDVFGMSYEYPYGRSVTEADVKESDTDLCFYVISRQCGESMDRNPDDSSYHLTQKELDDIRFCAAHYDRMVVVLNIGCCMDVKALDTIEGISAVVYMGMLGGRCGDAFASVILGEVSPSGHLSETWPKNYSDVPYGREFGVMNPNVLEQDYKEGIYVGYRYYDTFQVPVQYPFGYGLSYTDFAIEANTMKASGSKVMIDVSVRNTGTKYSGKEVIQVYISAPKGKIEKPYQQLAAFAKTSTLKPGASEVVELEIDMSEMGCYWEERKMTILEAGDYIVRVGNSSQNTAVAGVVHLQDEIVLSEHKGMGMRPIAFDQLRQSITPGCSQNEKGRNVQSVSISAGDFQTSSYSYTIPFPILDAESQKVLDSLTVEECIDLVVGDGLDILGKPHDFICPGAVGYTTSSLVKKGVPLLILSDGPNGLRIQKRNALGKNKIRPVDPMGEVFKYLPKWIYKLIHADPEKSTMLYQFATSFPVGNMIAQTWNVELLERQGTAVSDEMELFGINFWLAPGVNIHRNPLNGRNYEYYSEDPYLTGKLAAAVTRGVQKRAGTSVTLKHFCCNNQEEQRGYMSSNVSERVMREIYLKGFEIAVKESKPRGIMSSYNRCNGIYSSNNQALLQDVLRCEWGYDGLVMTDWFATSSMTSDAAKCMEAGNEMLMPGTEKDKKTIRKALRSGALKEADLRKCAGNIIRIARATHFSER